MTKSERTSEILSNIYALVHELEQLHPGFKFTPDGHMVGSFGEAYAVSSLGMAKHPNGTPVVDVFDPITGRDVQIKATQTGSGVYVKAGNCELLVLKINADGTVKVMWHGDNTLAFNSGGKLNKMDERWISFSTLKKLPQTARCAE